MRITNLAACVALLAACTTPQLMVADGGIDAITDGVNGDGSNGDGNVGDRTTPHDGPQNDLGGDIVRDGDALADVQSDLTCADGFGPCGSSCVNPNTDVNNCGACGMVCPTPTTGMGTPVCSVGHCALYCPPGTDNCDGLVANGCEVTLATDPNNCGHCGTSCPMEANATPACTGGTCGIACSAGYGDCNATLSDGCEAQLNTATNCGSCGNACPAATAPVCSMDMSGTSSCTTGCTTGQMFCPGSGSSGATCSYLVSDPNNCGACGTVCPSPPNASATCAGAACGFECATGYADCDHNAQNGCEVNLQADTNNCGTCANVCPAPSNARETESCSSGSCTSSCVPNYITCGFILVGNDCNCGGPHSSPTCDLHSGSMFFYYSCNLHCDPGWADCNSNTSDGCETYIWGNDGANCGGCGTVCNGCCVGGACLIC